MPKVIMEKVDHFMKASAAWHQGDLEEAFSEFHMGAKAGDSSCQIYVGIFYDDGLHVESNQNKALF